MRTVGAVPQVVVKAAPLEVVIMVGGPARCATPRAPVLCPRI
jgi:hypothetical protein